jgi:hypothetical protein
MRPSTNRRLALAAVGALMLWLAGTSVADASQARRYRQSQRSAGRVCDASTLERRAMTRPPHHPASFRRLIRQHVFALLQRNRIRSVREDDAAIQNGPAFYEHSERRSLTALEPSEFLATFHCQLFSRNTASRRSPRGPPATTA